MAIPVFPDVDAEIIKFLKGRLPDEVEYGTYVPHDYSGDRPFVMAHRIGGFTRWPALDNSTVELEVWHRSREVAHDIAQLVAAELLATKLIGQPFARVVVIAGLNFMTEDASELGIWSSTYQISMRPRRVDRGA